MQEGNVIRENEQDIFMLVRGGQERWSFGPLVQGIAFVQSSVFWNANIFGTGWYQCIKLSDRPFAMAGLEGGN